MSPIELNQLHAQLAHDLARIVPGLIGIAFLTLCYFISPYIRGK